MLLFLVFKTNNELFLVNIAVSVNKHSKNETKEKNAKEKRLKENFSNGLLNKKQFLKKKKEK